MTSSCLAALYPGIILLIFGFNPTFSPPVNRDIRQGTKQIGNGRLRGLERTELTDKNARVDGRILLHQPLDRHDRRVAFIADAKQQFVLQGRGRG